MCIVHHNRSEGFKEENSRGSLLGKIQMCNLVYFSLRGPQLCLANVKAIISRHIFGQKRDNVGPVQPFKMQSSIVLKVKMKG